MIAWLQHQDDLYEHEDDTEVSDDVYDKVRRTAKLMYPGNVYFTGVGSAVRGGKIKLPFQMFGLQQKYAGGELPEWLDDTNCKGQTYVESDKLDGSSASVVYDADGNLQIAYSRGNGEEAADITRHIRLIENIPKKIPPQGTTFAVRLEVIIPKDQWDIVRTTYTCSSGEPYKNIRNAGSGVMNSGSNDAGVYKHLRGVAYTVMSNPTMKKTDQYDLLKSIGFEIANYSVHTADNITDALLEERIIQRKKLSNYELDGIVIDANNKDSLNGVTGAIKFKITDESNIAVATVKDVVYRLSKDGYIKPRVNIFPTPLCGVTVRFATGFHAGFIEANGIGPGSKVRITRSGDVVPYIISVVSKVNPQLPDPEIFGDWEWSAKHVDAIVTDTTNNRDISIRKNVDIFTKLKIANLKAGSVGALYDAGFKTAVDIINATYVDLYQTLGENASKVDASLDERLTNIYWPVFAGAMNLFGRGMGIRKVTSAYEAAQGDFTKMGSYDFMVEVDGFDDITGSAISGNLEAAVDTISKVTERVSFRYYGAANVASGNKLENQVVVLTGFRDDELEAAIKDQGGEVGSGVTKTTTILVAKDPNESSGKTKKAHGYNKDRRGTTTPLIKIMSLSEFQQMLE